MSDWHNWQETSFLDHSDGQAELEHQRIDRRPHPVTTVLGKWLFMALCQAPEAHILLPANKTFEVQEVVGSEEH